MSSLAQASESLDGKGVRWSKKFHAPPGGGSVITNLANPPQEDKEVCGKKKLSHANPNLISTPGLLVGGTSGGERKVALSSSIGKRKNESQWAIGMPSGGSSTEAVAPAAATAAEAAPRVVTTGAQVQVQVQVPSKTSAKAQPAVSVASPPRSPGKVQIVRHTKLQQWDNDLLMLDPMTGRPRQSGPPGPASPVRSPRAAATATSPTARSAPASPASPLTHAQGPSVSPVVSPERRSIKVMRPPGGSSSLVFG